MMAFKAGTCAHGDGAPFSKASILVINAAVKSLKQLCKSNLEFNVKSNQPQLSICLFVVKFLIYTKRWVASLADHTVKKRKPQWRFTRWRSQIRSRRRRKGHPQGLFIDAFMQRMACWRCQREWSLHGSSLGMDSVVLLSGHVLHLFGWFSIWLHFLSYYDVENNTAKNYVFL